MISNEELRDLLESREPGSVSLFMPTHQAGVDVQQDPIRLRNLLSQAQERLLAGGARLPDARKWLAPAHDLADRAEFWDRQGRGLALFAAPGRFQYHRLPLALDELLVVSDRFHIKPLLPLFSGDGRFLLLALSQNEVRLLEGTRFRVAQLELGDVPQDLETALLHLGVEPEGRQLQFHTRTPTGPGGRRAAVFHGVGETPEKEYLSKYFRQIDSGLRQVTQGANLPLVLAGVDYLLPIYREASEYPGLLPEGITGNPERLRAEELHARAWEIVEPIFTGAQLAAREQYMQLAGGGSERAASELARIVPAAYHGRVETLFVALGVQQWGRFDPQSGEAHVHGGQEPGDVDLLDFAAAHTYLTGGKVYPVPVRDVPGAGPAAAVLRY